MNSTELGKIISFVKKASWKLFAFQLLKGFIFSVGILEVLACTLIMLSNFTNYIGRGRALSISGGAGLLILITWFFILLLKKPGLTHIVKVVDYRCGLQERLVTAWEFQQSNALFVPFLIDDLAPRLDKISSSTYIPFSFKKRFVIFFCAISLMLGVSIKMKTIQKKKHPHREVSHISSQMGIMADVLKGLDKQEGLEGHSGELSAVKKAAEGLRKTERLLSEGKISREEAAKEIGKIKDDIAESEPPLNDSDDDSAKNSSDSSDGAMDSFFYKLMDKLDKINVFDRKGVLKDILKVLDSFEIKLGGRGKQKLAKEGDKNKAKFKISKNKTPYTKTMYINMDTEKARKLGLLETENKSETNEHVDKEAINKKRLKFYKNYISSINSRAELSFVEKTLVIDYFDKLNKD